MYEYEIRKLNEIIFKKLSLRFQCLFLRSETHQWYIIYLIHTNRSLVFIAIVFFLVWFCSAYMFYSFLIYVDLPSWVSDVDYSLLSGQLPPGHPLGGRLCGCTHVQIRRDITLAHTILSINLWSLNWIISLSYSIS